MLTLLGRQIIIMLVLHLLMLNFIKRKTFLTKARKRNGPS